MEKGAYVAIADTERECEPPMKVWVYAWQASPSDIPYYWVGSRRWGLNNREG